MKIFLVLIAMLLTTALEAQSRAALPAPGEDPRGEPELTVCSQNLKNYGSFVDSKSREAGLKLEDFKEKEQALVSRFERAKCDVVGVQELLGRDNEKAQKAIDQLALALQKRTNRVYETRIGDTNDGISRVGFLVAKDRAEIASVMTYKKVLLPKLSEDQKPRLFSRSPLEIQLAVRPKGESQARTVSLVNFHFKSKSGASGDAAALEWETYRMEMAEGLRRILEKRFRNSFGSGAIPLLVLGDRNGNFDVASAKILDGTLPLSRFQGQAVCRLSKRGVPLCQGGVEGVQKLFSVLLGDPQTKLLHGTFVYEKIFSWLDDILVPAETLPLAWKRFDVAGDYDSGVISTPSFASDHALVWVRLNW